MKQLFHGSSRTTTILFGLFAAFIVISIVLFPSHAFKASIYGLNVWWKYVFPSMLPVLIISELMIGYGIVQGIGTMIEPAMRLIFRLPAGGGAACAASLFAGFPGGAKVTADLKQKQFINREEAERLLALSHITSPVLIVTVIGAGFLGSARLGFMLALIYYISHVLTGIMTRWSSGAKVPKVNAQRLDRRNVPGESYSLLNKAKHSMTQAHRLHEKTFGKMLGDAVMVSVQNLMATGGYIIIFSVISGLVKLTQIDQIFGTTTILPGLLEIHLGTFNASRAGDTLQWNVAVISAVLGWSGVSNLFQVKSIIHSTGIRIRTYVISRLIHTCLAFATAFLLWNMFNHWFDLLFV